MRLRDRIERLERMMDQPDFIDGGDGDPVVIRIKGCLPDADGQHASAGGLRFQRQPGEDQEEFERRVIEVAIEAGERVAVIGGLPDWYGDE
jgi:hypothetical protein